MSDNESLREKIKRQLPVVYLITALLAARWTLVEPYVVPTGSMEPTLKPGDRLYALKCAYDVRFPFTDWILFRTGQVKRGDVILFRSPVDPSITFVKRAVGLPGDRIRVNEGVLYINDKIVDKAPTEKRDIMYDIESQQTKTLYFEQLGDVKHHVILDRQYDNSPMALEMRHRSMPERTIPEGHLFAMGDNRDNSHDSRAWGFVPVENLKGRGMFIWFSSRTHAGMSFMVSAASWFDVRPERIGTLIR